MNQRKGWVKLLNASPGGIRTGRDVYVQNFHYPLYEKIIKNRSNDFHFCTMSRLIHGLSAGVDSKSRTISNSVYISIRNGWGLEYFSDREDILIRKIHLSHTFQENFDHRPSGLYRCTYKGGLRREWMVNENPSKEMDCNHRWMSSGDRGAHYAALSGKISDIGRTGALMPQHIKGAFGGKYFLLDQMEQDENHYSLYWARPGDHGSRHCADEVASLMQQAALKKSSVHWVVHGEACKTFSNALQQLKSLSNTHVFSTQKVALSNPRGAQPDDIKKLCAQVGIQFETANINPRDLRGSAVWRNSTKEIALIAATATLFGGTMTAVKRMGLETAKQAGEQMIQHVNQAFSNPSLLTIGSAALAGFVAINASKTCFTQTHSAYRAVMAYAHSTFGKGNQHWYQNDEQLIRNLS